MSAARIEHLKSLLSRVQERREQPRLRSVDAGQQDERVSEVVATTARIQPIQPPLAVEPVSLPAYAPDNFEEASPVVISGTPQPAVVQAQTEAEAVARRAPTLSDMPKVAQSDSDEPEIETHFDSEPPTGPSIVPEAIAGESAPEAAPEAAATASAPAQLTAPSERVSAPVLSQSAPVVQVVSAPRIEAPKNFGELLEASLGLRPR